jgi:hypothetical protein
MSQRRSDLHACNARIDNRSRTRIPISIGVLRICRPKLGMVSLSEENQNEKLSSEHDYSPTDDYGKLGPVLLTSSNMTQLFESFKDLTEFLVDDLVELTLIYIYQELLSSGRKKYTSETPSRKIKILSGKDLFLCSQTFNLSISISSS